MAAAQYNDRAPLKANTAAAANGAGMPPYWCMLMNSHQVPLSIQAVPKAQALAAAAPGV